VSQHASVPAGGSNLRVLAPGSRTFESLHRIPGDNLYRVASDARPELLWVGIEVGRGRDFVRLPFNDIEKRARAWSPN
jgi:hypothetical protein